MNAQGWSELVVDEAGREARMHQPRRRIRPSQMGRKHSYLVIGKMKE